MDLLRGDSNLRLLIGALVLLLASPLDAKVFLSKQEALKAAFPEAQQIVDHDVFLTPDQIRQVEEKSSSKVESSLVTLYEGRIGGRSLGWAFLDTHVVRTQPETFMVVIGPTGQVKSTFVCAFYEPQEYMPSDRWMAQFNGRSASAQNRVDQDVVGITGSTLSARALAGGVRKALALISLVTPRLVSRVTGAVAAPPTPGTHVPLVPRDTSGGE